MRHGVEARSIEQEPQRRRHVWAPLKIETRSALCRTESDKTSKPTQSDVTDPHLPLQTLTSGESYLLLDLSPSLIYFRYREVPFTVDGLPQRCSHSSILPHSRECNRLLLEISRDGWCDLFGVGLSKTRWSHRQRLPCPPSLVLLVDHAPGLEVVRQPAYGCSADASIRQYSASRRQG